MKPENNYEKIIGVLRESGPGLDSTENIETEVIRKIRNNYNSGFKISDVVDFLFQWVYIGWVRRSLIAASVIIIMVFVYQQVIILRRIDLISKQTIVIDKENFPATGNEIERLLMSYRISGKRLTDKVQIISEKDMKGLIEYVNELQIKYKDLENLINADPDLKKQIEEKLLEKKLTKINL